MSALILQAAVDAFGPIHSLLHADYTDVYRLIFPDASAEPGFTHIIDSALRPSRSRIDYIWTLGIPCRAHTDIRIDLGILDSISHHRPLWMEIDLKLCGIHRRIDALDPPAIYQMRLPNLRGLTETQQLRFVRHLEKRLTTSDEHLHALADLCSKDSLGALASELASHARKSAFATLPITGDRPFLTKGVAILARQCRDLIRIRAITRQLLVSRAGAAPSTCPEWRRLHAQCTHEHRLRWHTDTDRDIDS